MTQSHDGSPLEILVTVDVQTILTRVTEEDVIFYRAVMVFSSKDMSSLSYTCDAEVLSANGLFCSGKVSDASLESTACTNLLCKYNPARYFLSQTKI